MKPRGSTHHSPRKPLNLRLNTPSPRLRSTPAALLSPGHPDHSTWCCFLRRVLARIQQKWHIRSTSDSQGLWGMWRASSAHHLDKWRSMTRITSISWFMDKCQPAGEYHQHPLAGKGTHHEHQLDKCWSMSISLRCISWTKCQLASIISIRVARQRFAS